MTSAPEAWGAWWGQHPHRSGLSTGWKLVNKEEDGRQFTENQTNKVQVSDLGQIRLV